MNVPAHIFKAYDIRGLHETELTSELAYRIARAFAVFLQREKGKIDLRLVMCRDMRPSSIPLSEAVKRGLMDAGISVVDIGLASTPTFYFGVSYYGFDGGIQVTASHNPAEYNGLKMVRDQAIPVSGETGIHTIREMVEKENLGDTRTGTYEEKTGVLGEQIAYAFSFVPAAKHIKPFSIVIDTANGMGAPIAEALFAKLPQCTIHKLYFELDGMFPNHEADPLKDENNKALQDKVRELNADLGITMDGDADRLFFVDNTGKTIEPAIVRGIFAKLFLVKNPGAPICYDIRPGRITIDMIEEAGGQPVVTRVGHSLIKEKAREVHAPFAGESSGHFFVGLPHGMYESPDIMILMFLEELSRANESVSTYIKPLQKYSHSGEINFSVKDKQKVFDRLSEAYGGYMTYDFDGLTFEWPDWWFNVRASNTESKIRLNLESLSEALTKEKVAEVSDLITNV
jgi:phosphomannomutase